MTNDEIQKALLELNGAFIQRLKTKRERGEASSFLMHLGFELTKGIEGKDFLKGWLDMAKQDLDLSSEVVVLKELH